MVSSNPRSLARNPRTRRTITPPPRGRGRLTVNSYLSKGFPSERRSPARGAIRAAMVSDAGIGSPSRFGNLNVFVTISTRSLNQPEAWTPRTLFICFRLNVVEGIAFVPSSVASRRGRRTTRWRAKREGRPRGTARARFLKYVPAPDSRGDGARLVPRRRGVLGRGDAGLGLAPGEQPAIPTLVPLQLGEQRVRSREDGVDPGEGGVDRALRPPGAGLIPDLGSLDRWSASPMARREQRATGQNFPG